MAFLSPTCMVTLDGRSSSVFVEWTSWTRPSDQRHAFPVVLSRIDCREKVACLVPDVGLNVLVMHASVRSLCPGHSMSVDWTRPVRMTMTRPLAEEAP